MRKKRSQ
jgi:hypothetical protein